jgi:glucose/arabinose dehydrogenase
MVVSLLPAGVASGAELPEGFVDTEVLDGLELPTAVRFSPDGRIFVAEKSGLLKVFDDLSDDQPAVFADLRLQVNDYFDRGLLGLALDPEFPAEPHVYVLYTHDAEIGGSAPRWGSADGGDDCPNPPGGFVDGCVVSGRLSRLTAAGSAMVGSELILVEDWCQQFWGHSVGALEFDSEGNLYAGAGEGASATMTDYGQAGIPRNPCGDPPGGVGAVLAPTTAQGGALRSQDLLTPSDPQGLSGSIVRVDPDSGEGLPQNPLGSALDENLRRLVAVGLRNPFRFALRPGTDELWVGDVGWSSWEEIDRFELPGPGDPVPNGGWPCYEGPAQQPAWASLGMDLCTSLYASPQQVRSPFFSYPTGRVVTPGEKCLIGQGSSISALAFYDSGGYPEDYDGALFFGDYARRCIWAMPLGEDGQPDPDQVFVFEQGSGSAVDLQPGPGGDLFYVDIASGSIHRIGFLEGNRPPAAVLEASPTDGPVDPPLVVELDASSSTDPDGDELAFQWDLDEDGEFDDAVGASPAALTFEEPEDRLIAVRVSEAATEEKLADMASVTIHAGNSRPTATIVSPDPGELWDAGTSIEFTGEGTDADDGPLSGAALVWSVILEHCPSACHEHFVSKSLGAIGHLDGPAHEYPASLVLRLTARDSGGLQGSDELELHPRTAQIRLRSEPPGVPLTIGAFSAPAPFSLAVIRGSPVQISAPRTLQLAGAPASFLRWQDGLAAYPDPVRSFLAVGDATLSAFYDWRPPVAPPPPEPGLACTDGVAPRSSLRPSGVVRFRAGIHLRGQATDVGCPAAGLGPPGVSVYLARRRGRRCSFLRGSGLFAPPRACRRPLLLAAAGFAHFGRHLEARLAPGAYLAGSLAFDGAGNREAPAAANRVEFHVLAQ